MNRLGTPVCAKVLGMLVEGNSIEATSRMADVSINTVTKLLVDVGSACADYQNATLRNLPCRRIQCDEIWSFCYSKERNVPAAMQGQHGVGDVGHGPRYVPIPSLFRLGSSGAEWRSTRTRSPPI